MPLEHQQACLFLKIPNHIVEVLRVLILVRVFILITLYVSRRILYVLTARYALALSRFVETLLVGAGVLTDVG